MSDVIIASVYSVIVLFTVCIVLVIILELTSKSRRHACVQTEAHLVVVHV